MLAFVGEANDGRFLRGAGSGVVDPAASTPTEVRGEVRRRFGADSSISKNPLLARCLGVVYTISRCVCGYRC